MQNFSVTPIKEDYVEVLPSPTLMHDDCIKISILLQSHYIYQKVAIVMIN